MPTTGNCQLWRRSCTVRSAIVETANLLVLTCTELLPSITTQDCV